TASVDATATAASKALPPCDRIAQPACVAIGWALAMPHSAPAAGRQADAQANARKTRLNRTRIQARNLISNTPCPFRYSLLKELTVKAVVRSEATPADSPRFCARC